MVVDIDAASEAVMATAERVGELLGHGPVTDTRRRLGLVKAAIDALSELRQDLSNARANVDGSEAAE
jgi:pilus assembly protein TadC